MDFGRVLSPHVDLTIGTADLIRHQDRLVELAGGELLPYDYLVHAVGSRASASIPGARENAHTVAEYGAAATLRRRLHQLSAHDRITVVGAGLTGVEVAGELAERGQRVTLVTDRAPAAFLGAAARRTVVRRLATLGIDLRMPSSVAEVGPDAVILDDGEVLAGGLTIWAGGFVATDLARRSGLSTDARGRLRTDATLTSIDIARIVAAGDAGDALRMSCQAALPLGARAADTVLSRLAGHEPSAILPGFAGQNVSLGRRSAVVQGTRRDDTPIGLHLGGRPGAAVKELVSHATLWFLRAEAARPGSYRWFRGPSARIPVEAG